MKVGALQAWKERRKERRKGSKNVEGRIEREVIGDHTTA